MLLIPLNDVVTSTNWYLTWTVNQLISLKISYPDENQNQFGCTVPNIFFIAPAQSYDENSRTPPEPNKENRPIFMRTVPWQYLLNFKERVSCTYIFVSHRIFQEPNLPICDSMIYEILPSLEFNCYFLELKQ